MGKLLLATPIIRALKVELDAEVHLITRATNFSAFHGNPYVVQLYDFNLPIGSIRRSLKKERFDYVIDFQDTMRSLMIRSGIAKSLVMPQFRLKKWMYARFKVNLLPKKHLIETYFDNVAPFQLSGDNLGLDFFIPEKDHVENNWLPITHRDGYAAVVISAPYATRQLPTLRLIELCDRINKPIVLIGDSDDIKRGEEIEAFFKKGSMDEEEELASLNKKTVVFNACGKFNFNQNASVVKHAAWVFTGDNDMMHVAAALKKPLFTIWGNTTPHLGAYPYRTKFTVFENAGLGCRPCTSKGFKHCPKGHFKCMNDVTFDFYLPD